MQVRESGIVGEQDILLLGGVDSDCTVVLNDLGVQVVWEAHEELRNVLPVVTELRGSMGEDISGRINDLVPRDNPFTMGIDSARWLCCAKNKLDLSKLFGFSLIMDDGILSCKNMVKINCPSCEEVCPLRVWELRLGIATGMGKTAVQGQGVWQVRVWCPILATWTKPCTCTAVSRVLAGFQPCLPNQISFLIYLLTTTTVRQTITMKQVSQFHC
jgi:hypothetical protein